jgi:hypothetical protein
MPNFLSTAALDADTLQANFIAYLKTQDRFKDYDYSGSNFSAFLGVLMQNTQYGNHYLNMVGSEAFLDTAELRASIVSRAKELNYTPRSRTSARSLVNILIQPNDSPDNITIPKGFAFTTTQTSSFKFITNQNYVISPVDGVYSVSGVEIFEGELVTEVFDVITDNTNPYTKYVSRFVLQSENVDISSIEVYVQKDSSSPLVKYTKKLSLFGLSNNDAIYFINGYDENQYEIVFGDNINGKGLISGNIVTVKYRDTVGSDGNGIGIFKAGTSIQGYSNISVTGAIVSYGGAEREDNDSIKFNATRHYQVQERAVIADDYAFLVKENFPEIESVSVYGGELEKQYGKVIISLKPYGNSGLVSLALKNRIINFLKLKNMTTEPVIVDADFFYIGVTSSVRYNVDLVTTNTQELKSKVTNALVSLNTSTYNNFGQNVYSSRLEATINDCDAAIISNSTNLKIIKKLSPTVNQDNNYSINFGNELNNPGVRFQYPIGYETVVTSTLFTYTVDNVDYTSWLADNGVGKILVYTKDINGDVVALGPIGNVDYTNGIVSINLNVKGYTSSINVSVITESQDILINKNKFILLNASDFNISMVANA